MKAEVEAALLERYGRSDFILKYDNDQFFLDRPMMLERLGAETLPASSPASPKPRRKSNAP